MAKGDGEERTICLFFSPYAIDLDKTGLVYKFNIQINSSSAGNIVVLADDRQMFSPIATFFKQDSNKLIHHVGCGVIGSKLFIVPNEQEVDSDFVNTIKHTHCSDTPNRRLYPLQFDFLTNQTDPLIRYPLAPKVLPFVIPIHNKIYVLSAHCLQKNYRILNPTFEAYDSSTGSWEPLPQPPFHKNNQHQLCGYAVVTTEKEEVFIITVGVFRGKDVGCFSYNVRTRAWKPVSVAEGSSWWGEAVAVGSHIYFYNNLSQSHLEALSIHYSDETDEISLGSLFMVKGLRMQEMPEKDLGYEFESGTIGKIGDRMLCVVHTASPCFMPWQCVLVSIVQIREDDLSCCETLNSFMFGLEGEEDVMNTLLITSCFAL